MKATQYRVLGTVERYSEALGRLKSAGDVAIVVRQDRQRQLVMRCPDGCGDVLSINLDPESGPAWRLYRRRGSWSLFPSIDRSTGCLSHFILSRGRILWIDWDSYCSSEHDAEFEERRQRIMSLLVSRERASFVELADELDEVPWDVLDACRRLVRDKTLEEGWGKERGTFWMRRATEEP